MATGDLDRALAEDSAFDALYGRTTWVWDVKITDEVDRIVAVNRVTIAVRAAERLSR